MLDLYGWPILLPISILYLHDYFYNICINLSLMHWKALPLNDAQVCISKQQECCQSLTKVMLEKITCWMVANCTDMYATTWPEREDFGLFYHATLINIWWSVHYRIWLPQEDQYTKSKYKSEWQNKVIVMSLCDGNRIMSGFEFLGQTSPCTGRDHLGFTVTCMSTLHNLMTADLELLSANLMSKFLPKGPKLIL